MAELGQLTCFVGALHAAPVQIINGLGKGE